MTNEEAIKYIPRIKKYYGTIDFTRDSYTASQWFECVTEALEKQIPKKPDESYDGYADGFPVWDYSCPCCGREIDDTDHHCICGQTIDWSEEE